MLRFFGRRKEESKPEVDLPKAILRNKEAIETLEKRQVHLERRITAHDEEARQRAHNGDKRGALFALKRKKMLEKELEQLGNAHLTLEQQIITLESAQTQQLAVGALAAGVTAQRALNQQLNISKIDELMEDMQEQANVQNELASILTQGTPLLDDAELLAELHELEVQELEETLSRVADVPEGLPGPPSITVSASQEASPPNSIVVSRTDQSSQSCGMSEDEQLKRLMNELV